MNHKIVYETSHEDLKQAIKDVLKTEIEDKVLDKFINIQVDSKAACQILQISNSSLNRYIEAGLIQPEQRSSEKEHRKFRLSTLLRLDISDVKRKYRYSY